MEVKSTWLHIIMLKPGSNTAGKQVENIVKINPEGGTDSKSRSLNGSMRQR